MRKKGNREEWGRMLDGNLLVYEMCHTKNDSIQDSRHDDEVHLPVSFRAVVKSAEQGQRNTTNHAVLRFKRLAQHHIWSKFSFRPIKGKYGEFVQKRDERIFTVGFPARGARGLLCGTCQTKQKQVLL